MSPSAIDNDAGERRVTVTLPDMFKGFLVGAPALNRYHDVVGAESEDWLQRSLSLSLKQQQRVSAGTFPYFVSVLLPDCPRQELRIVTDYFLWVFIFDDMFDDGELKDDPTSSRRIVDNLLSVMVPELKRTSQEAIVDAHDDIYKRFAATASPSVEKRYVKYMKHYCAGCLQHVEDYSADRTPTLQEMLDTRRMSIGVYPMYPLVEFAYGLDIPEYVFSDPSLQTLENLGAEFVMMMNDVLSYRKEEKLSCPFNMVAVARMRGASAQEAFDEIATMIDERHVTWNKALKSLPSWGREIDGQVRQYVKGIQDLVQANLSWSFRTKRYFGANADMVRKYRQIDVLMQPSFITPHAVEA